MTIQPSAVQLKAMIGDYPITHRLLSGQVSPGRYAFDFADVKVPNTAFKRAVRNLEFDVSELAIVTFLQAFDAGIPLVLLPAVIVSRFQLKLNLILSHLYPLHFTFLHLMDKQAVGYSGNLGT